MMDKYFQSKRNLARLKLRLKRLEERRAIERQRRRLIKKIVMAGVLMFATVITVFVFY